MPGLDELHPTVQVAVVGGVVTVLLAAIRALASGPLSLRGLLVDEAPIIIDGWRAQVEFFRDEAEGLRAALASCRAELDRLRANGAGEAE